MDLENVRREDWIVGGLALLLAIFLLVLPWFKASASAFGVTVSASSSATGDPDGWLGILAFLACLALVADIAVERFSPQTQVPLLNSRVHTRFVIAAVAAALIVLKFLFHIHFTGVVKFGWGFYVDIIVTAALVYFALQVRNGVTIGGPSLGGRRTGAGGPGGGPAAPATRAAGAGSGEPAPDAGLGSPGAAPVGPGAGPVTPPRHPPGQAAGIGDPDIGADPAGGSTPPPGA